MANQLCRRAETNHRIAESITVSHGNTSPQLSVFIKRGWVPALVAGARGQQGYVWYALLRACKRWPTFGCNLDCDKEGDREALSSAP